jgi:hypothetical protein
MPDLSDLDLSSYSATPDYSGSANAAGTAVTGVFYLAAYVYFALVFMTLAKKFGVKHVWMAWVPILNLFLFVKLAGKSYWWALAFLVPILNIVLYFWYWSLIFKRGGRPGWWWVLMLIPVVNIIMPGILAWGKSSHPTVPAVPVA